MNGMKVSTPARWFIRVLFPMICTLAAHAQVAQRNLLVELRQVPQSQDGASHYSAGSAAPGQTLMAQSVQVRNDGSASLRLENSVPVQWVRSAAAQAASFAASAAQGSSSAGGVTLAQAWFESGQRITVHPLWPGGKQPVRLEVSVEQMDLQDNNNSPLPAQSRSQMSTTISAAPGKWVTLATSGSGAGQTGYSSTAVQAPLLLQIRVDLAP
jgi:hypothetical protein